MLERLGRFMYRGRWVVIPIWICIFGISAYFAPRVTAVLHGGGYTIGKSQSVDAYNQLHRAFGYRALTFTVVFTAPAARHGQILPDARQFRERAERRFGHRLTVAAPVWSPDHAIAFERIYSQPQSDLGAGFAAPLRALLPSHGVRAYLSGSSAIFHDMEVVSDQDLKRVEIVTLPLAALVLLIIFGSVVASATPVLMAPIAVSLALASIAFIGQRVDMSIFVLNTASMLGLGVAIDYSLFMVNRFREEIRLGRDLETAVGRTVATSGRAILVSAVVVTVGFYALSLTGVSMLRSIGIGGSIVTAYSLLVALTLLPSILGVLGHRINLLPVVPRRFTGQGAWRRIALGVMRRPVVVILGVGLVILALATPAFHLRVGIPGPEILPPSVDSRAGNDILNQHLGIANQSPVLVVAVRKPNTPVSTERGAVFQVLDRVCSSSEVAGLSAAPVPDSPRQIYPCQQILAQLQGGSKAGFGTANTVSRQRHVALLSVFLHADPSSAAAERYVTFLRHTRAIPGYELLIGGQTAGQMDFDNYLYSKFPLVVLFVLVTIYAVLFAAFRSVLLPLKAILMNAFSVFAAYGVTVWSFQDGHLAGILGFTPVGNIDSIVPVFLFSVLFGISTDYEVFLLTRIQEEYRRTGNNEESVARGLEATGRIITSAAAVMIVVFAAFAFARLVVIKELGLGLAVAVLVDATLIRVLLVPATMRLLGRWNWWLPIRGFLPVEPEDEETRNRVAS
jgi:RND superfamily putative drug exporter